MTNTNKQFDPMKPVRFRKASEYEVEILAEREVEVGEGLDQ